MLTIGYITATALAVANVFLWGFVLLQRREPKCNVEIKLGAHGAYHWTARSTGTQRVGAYTFLNNEIISKSTVRAYESREIAENELRAALRGWNITIKFVG